MSQREAYYEKALEEILRLCREASSKAYDALAPRIFREDAQAEQEAFKRGVLAAVKYLTDRAAVTLDLATDEQNRGYPNISPAFNLQATMEQGLADRIREQVDDPAKLLKMMEEKP